MSLAGYRFYTQFGAFDRRANQAGFTLSRGAALTIGRYR